jgi:hypothetical protein
MAWLASWRLIPAAQGPGEGCRQVDLYTGLCGWVDGSTYVVFPLRDFFGAERVVEGTGGLGRRGRGGPQ